MLAIARLGSLAVKPQTGCPCGGCCLCVPFGTGHVTAIRLAPRKFFSTEISTEISTEKLFECHSGNDLNESGQLFLHPTWLGARGALDRLKSVFRHFEVRPGAPRQSTNAVRSCIRGSVLFRRASKMMRNRLAAHWEDKEACCSCCLLEQPLFPVATKKLKRGLELPGCSLKASGVFLRSFWGVPDLTLPFLIGRMKIKVLCSTCF
jgi:hypothetical protein